jgi:hypothetical protein
MAVVGVHLALGFHVGAVAYVLARQDANWIVLARVIKVDA